VAARKKKRKSYHHGNLRRALIDATVEFLGDSPPEMVKVREIARRAGVSSGAPFRHFEDRADLLRAVADEAFGEIQRLLEQAVKRNAGDPAKQFSSMGAAYVRFAVEHPGQFRLMALPEYVEPRRVLALQGLMHESIVAAQTEGVFRKGDAQLLLLTSFSLVHGLARLLVDRGLLGDMVSPRKAHKLALRVMAEWGLGIEA
jgi:AcrR family transcriptional regulator